MVQRQDLEVLANIGLRHIFFWRGEGYYRDNLAPHGEGYRIYKFLLATLGEPVDVSHEVEVFRIPTSMELI